LLCSKFMLLQYKSSYMEGELVIRGAVHAFHCVAVFRPGAAPAAALCCALPAMQRGLPT
jgi:hypothetical protein